MDNRQGWETDHNTSINIVKAIHFGLFSHQITHSFYWEEEKEKSAYCGELAQCVTYKGNRRSR